jgi:protein-disulfide isomerase
VKRWSAIGIGAVAIAAVGLGTVAIVRGSRDASAEAPARAQARPPLRQDVQSTYLAARTKGSPDAPVTVLEASDFQCPYCRVFAEETLPLLQREYIDTGKIRFVFLNLPLPSLHPNATAAHEFAMCAAVQNRFWPAHDLLYRHQEAWAGLNDPSEYFYQLGDSAALDRGQLAQCFDQGLVRDIIQQEAEQNFRAGLRSTPSFVIEGGRMPGAQPIEVWRPILDSIVAVRRSQESGVR